MKVINYKISVFITCLFFASQLECSSAITMSSVGGRLGNLLSTYVQARWLAHKYHLTFIYYPVPELEPFKLSSQTQSSQVYDLSEYNFKIIKKNKIDRKIKRTKRNRIYIQSSCYLSPPRMAEMKKDLVFLKAIREEISPKSPLELILPPKGMISVAVHLRKGGGYDRPLKSVQIFRLHQQEDPHPKSGTVFDDKAFPLRFVPEQFYIDQLKELGKEFFGKPVYVFIFTDDRDPKALTERVEKEVGLENFQFHCRTENTGHDKNVLEDLFSMPNFAHFILPHSTFSNIATLLGDFETIIYPAGYHWEKDANEREYLVIDKVVWSREAGNF